MRPSVAAGGREARGRDLRFFTSILLLLASLLALLLGIGQQTWLKPSPTVSEQVRISGVNPYVVVDGAVLAQHDGDVQVTVKGEGSLVAATAVADDVTAWIGDTTADVVTSTVSGGQILESRGTETDSPDPTGSDLWTEQHTGENALSFQTTPDTLEALLIADTAGAVPTSVELSWQQDTSTPWAVPLIIVGGLMLLGGIAVLISAVVDESRRGGPRRHSRRAGRAWTGIRPTTPRRHRHGGARAFGVLATVLVSLFAVTGCASGAPAGTSSASSTQDEVVASGPRLTSTHVKTILSDIATVANQADSNRDADLAATRFGGAALLLRKANYQARTADASIASPTGITTTTPAVFLPQLDSSWPRQALVVLDQDADAAPIALYLVQQSPRENYKVMYEVELLSDAEFPELPSAQVGGVSLAPSTTLLSVAPDEVGNAYADVIANGDQSVFASLFAATSDAFIDASKVHESDATAAIEGKGSVSFSRSQSDETEALSMSTADSGGIVAVLLTDSESSTPSDGYEITVSGEASALLGKTATESGLTTTYGDMLLFSVPAAGAEGQGIELLGFSSGILDVKEG